MILGGAGCLVGALLIYWFWYRRSARRYDAIVTIPRIAAHDIPGLGAAMVDLAGQALAEKPLVSDLARVPCVAFRSSVTEHWTTIETERDSKGNTRMVTRHHSEARYSNDAQIDFQLRDESGDVTVRPQGASIDLLNSLADFTEPPLDSPAHGIGPVHGGSLNYDETVLPIGRQIYVLGQVSEDHAIQRAADCDQPFIISYRREEDLVWRALWSKRCGALVALTLLVAGLGLVLGGIQNSTHRPEPYESNDYPWNVGGR